jgi:hypothetical protein
MPKTEFSSLSPSRMAFPSSDVIKTRMFNLTTPAYILLIAYAILVIVILLPFELKIYNEVTQEFEIIEYNFMYRFLLVLYISLPIFLHVLSVNCMMIGSRWGGCVIWTYIYTFVNIIWITAFIIIAFTYAFGRK